MTRRALGVSVLCFLFLCQAGAQGQAGDNTSYAAGWGGGFQGRPWFDGGWPQQYRDRVDPKWFGYSGNPVWAYDAIIPKPEPQPRQIVIVLLGQTAEPAKESVAPARLEVHEYKWPDSGRPQTETFSIALKGGITLTATLVCVQGDSILCVAPDGTCRLIPFASIDSDATRNLNAKKDLQVWLLGNQAETIGGPFASLSYPN